MIRINNKKILIYLFVSMILVFLSCQDKNQSTSQINVVVSVPPQAYFVERIGGSKVDVDVMIPKSFNPATYEPTSKQMMKLSDAQVYVKVGVPGFAFEEKHFSTLLEMNKKMVVVDMSQGIIFRKDSHHHVNDHKHDETINYDPHIWVSPVTVRKSVINICKAFVELDKENKEFYKKNLKSFLTEIDKLDRKLRNLLSKLDKRSFMVYHPAWSYFARDYNLNQIAIEVHGKKPSAKSIKVTIEKAKKERISVIFVQKGFPTEQAKVIAREISAEVIQIDPLEKNWLKNMYEIAKVFRKAME